MSESKRPIDSDLPDVIAPAEDSDVEHLADEQFTHGLLRFLHRDTRTVQEARIARAMNTLNEACDQPVIAGRIAATRTSWRGIAVAAAGVALVAVIALLGLSTEQSAQAMMQEVIEASEQAGPRRYEVRLQRPDADAKNTETEPIATLDMLDPQHMLFRAQMPHGHRIVAGRNTAGEWAIRPTGEIEHYRPGRAWPRWVEFSDNTLLLESVDALLKRLSKSYTLRYIEVDQQSDVDINAAFDHITATKADGPLQLPDRIELRIDPQTHIVQRMELHWSFDRKLTDEHRRRMRQRVKNRNDRNVGSDQRHPDEAARHERRRRMQRDGQPVPTDVEPPTASPNDIGQPERPPRTFNGRRGDQNRPTREMRQPRFLDGPPQFRQGKHAPPPRVIIFELVDRPAFAPDWFDPEAHLQ